MKRGAKEVLAEKRITAREIFCFSKPPDSAGVVQIQHRRVLLRVVDVAETQVGQAALAGKSAGPSSHDRIRNKDRHRTTALPAHIDASRACQDLRNGNGG